MVGVTSDKWEKLHVKSGQGLPIGGNSSIKR